MSLGTRRAVRGPGVPWLPWREGEPSEVIRFIRGLEAQREQGLPGGDTGAQAAALGCSQDCLFSGLHRKGALGPEKLLANDVKCSVPSQCCLSLGFIGNQLCSDLEAVGGEALEMVLAGESDARVCGRWRLVLVSQAAWVPSPPLPDVPLLTKGLGPRHTALSDLNPSSWFRAPPTVPQSTNKNHFPTPV